MDCDLCILITYMDPILDLVRWMREAKSAFDGNVSVILSALGGCRLTEDGVAYSFA